MGSRVMHYCITSLIGASLGIDDRSFLLGGLAPDLHTYMGPSKYYLTHFAFRDDEGKTETDYEQYRSKYLVRDVSPFYHGYYFHLISDDIWKREIYYPKIKSLEPKKRKVVLEKNYRDFWRLNGKIIDHYSLELQELIPMAVVMDEIDHRFFSELIHALYGDFELQDEASGEALEILDFAEVLSIIDTSVKQCLDAYASLTNSAL